MVDEQEDKPEAETGEDAVDEGAKTRPKESRLRRLAVLIAVFAAIGFVLNLLVDNPYTHHFLRAVISEKIEENTNLTVDFKALKVNLMPPGVDLYGLKVGYVGMSEEKIPSLATASHAKARLSLWALFLGEIKLSVVEADDLALIWPPPWGFKGFLKNQDHGPPAENTPVTWPPDVDLPLERVRLTNAKVYAELPLVDKVPMKASYFVTSAIGIDLDLDIENLSDLDGSLQIKSLNAAFDASSMLEEATLDIKAELGMGKLNVSRLKIRGERLNTDGELTGDFETSGKDKLLKSVKLAASLDATGDMSALGSFLDLPDTRGPMRGKVAVKAEIPVEAPGDPTYEIKVDGQVDGAQLYGFKLLNSKAKLTIMPEGVNFDAIELILGEQKLADVTGKIRLTDAIDFDFRGEPRGLRLMDLLGALGVDFEVFDTTLDSSDLRVYGQAFPFALNVAATAQATEITLPATPIETSAFPISPGCRIDLHLLVTDAQLDFNGTRGNCFTLSSPERVATPAAGDTSSPASAANESPVEFGGQIRFAPHDDLTLTLRSNSLALALGTHFAQVPLTGDAESTTVIRGKGDEIVIDNFVKAKDVTVRGLPLGNVAGQVTIVGNEVRWQNAALDFGGPGSLMAPSGKLLIDDLTIDTRIAAHGIDQASMKRFFHAISPELGLAFAVEGLDGQLKGPLLYPFAYGGTLALRVRDLELEGARLSDQIFATVRLDQKGINVDDLSASLGDLALTARLAHKRAFPFSLEEAEGTENPWVAVGLHPDDTATLEIQTVESALQFPEEKERLNKLDHLGALPYVGPILREIGIKGLINVTGKFSGSPGSLDGTFGGEFARPSIFGSAMPTINLKGFVKNGQIDVVVDQGGSALEGRLSVDVLKKGVPYEWFFSLNRLDLRAFMTDVFFSDARNYAYLTASWRMQGNFEDWWRSTGELDIKDIRAKYFQDIGSSAKALAIKQENPVRLNFTPAGWQFENQRDLYLAGRNVQLRVSMGQNAPPEKLAIKLEGIIDVGLLRDFTQQIETASGKVRVIAEVKGSVAKPEFTMEISDLKPNPFIAATWSPLTLGLADVRPAFRNIRLRVLYEGGRLVVDSFAADKGSGTVTASGSINVADEGGEESRLDVALNDATVSVPVAVLKSFEATLKGSVSVTGRGVPYKVTGDVEIARARSTSEVDIRDEIINALRSQSFTAALKSDQPVVQFDLNITADQSINIHNRNMQALLSTDLVIRGTDVTPSVAGQVDVAKGKFIYKRDFQITRGLIAFDDPVKPDPTLDILAVSEVDQYRVYFALTGRASNPTVEFSIDPPVREDGTAISKVEILVLLSRGKLPEANRSVGQSTQSAATSEAINLIMGQFEEPVEKLFELSGQSVVRNVYIDTHPSQDGDPVPRFNLPLDLGEDFDVVVRVDQGSEEASAEYDVHENIKLLGALERQRENQNAEVQSANTPEVDAKVNLKFRFSFD